MAGLTGVISQRLDNKQDRFFDNVALGSTATITSSAKRCAKVSSHTEIAIIADTEIINAANLTVSITASTAVDGTFNEVQNVVYGAGTIAAGTQFFTYTPDTTVPHYVKVAITTAEDLSADKVTATIYYTA